MNIHQIAVIVLGFILVFAAPITYKKFDFDGLFCVIAFIVGCNLIVNGNC